MIELFDDKLTILDRKSSKGNQLKWKQNDIWYKADYTGYEGLAECIVCRVLKNSNINKSEYAFYDLESIRYKSSIFTGVSSKSFLKDDWQIITLERLFKSKYNKSLTETIWGIHDVNERLEFLVHSVQNITGLMHFGEYITKMLTIDAIFLNEDRHMHNVAVLVNGNGEFDYCPFFDHGASLLSDTTMDYPIGIDVLSVLNDVEGKTIASDFDEALDAAEAIYGNQLKIKIDKKVLFEYIDKCDVYSIDIRNRVKKLLQYQIRKYQYIFAD